VLVLLGFNYTTLEKVFLLRTGISLLLAKMFMILYDGSGNANYEGVVLVVFTRGGSNISGIPTSEQSAISPSVVVDDLILHEDTMAQSIISILSALRGFVGVVGKYPAIVVVMKSWMAPDSVIKIVVLGKFNNVGEGVRGTKVMGGN
jgi:hypothetical protein